MLLLYVDYLYLFLTYNTLIMCRTERRNIFLYLLTENRESLEKLINKQRFAAIPSVYLESASDLTEPETQDSKKVKVCIYIIFI